MKHLEAASNLWSSTTTKRQTVHWYEYDQDIIEQVYVAKSVINSMDSTLQASNDLF